MSTNASAISHSLHPILLLERASAILVVILALTWGIGFRTSFKTIYSILHPLLMVIGFIVISGEAILIHRWLPGSRSTKKSVHMCMQGVALASGILGMWTKFHGRKGILANFYSLHSWMGVMCVFSFGIQWVVGFIKFWHRGEVRMVRERILPWHIFLGLYTYGLAIATAETGLLEALTKLQIKRNLPLHGSESMIVNCLGLGLMLLSGLVILAAVSPRSQRHQESKVVHDSNGKSYI